MADRCSASIVIGGTLAAEHVPALLALIEQEGLATDYDDAAFDPDALVSGEPLMLCAYEVSWGTFNDLEPFCREHKLAYSRWHGACAGVWGCAGAASIAALLKGVKAISASINTMSAMTIRY